MVIQNERSLSSRLIVARILSIFIFLFPLVPLSSQNLVINEINYNPRSLVGSGFDYVSHEWVEIYNPDTTAVDLSGWTITNRNGSTAIMLPSWTLPGQSFLTVHQSVGSEDMDFSDLDGHFYTGDSTDLFSSEQDECALYNGTPGPNSIIDFTAWDRTGAYAPGTAHDFAIAAAIWNSGDFFNSQQIGSSDLLTRFFDGYDRNVSGDWHEISWTTYAQNNGLFPENPIQQLPYHRTIENSASPNFFWIDIPFADSYEIQIDNDFDFSSPENQATGLTSSNYQAATPLANDAYFWRVRAILGGAPTPWSAEWLVVIYSGILPGSPKSCPHKWQHKDSRLLCIWDQDANTRPGSPETGKCAWDIPHPDANPPTNGCDHGKMYCVAASIAMMNERYGGDLTQDRITYQVSSTRRGQPEGDLGHEDGMFDPAVNNEIETALEWALSGTNVNVMAGPFTFAQLKPWIRQRDCFMAKIPGHMMVLDGFAELISTKGDLIQVVYAQDPWKGPNYPLVFNYMINGAPKAYFRRHGKNNLEHVFLQPTTGVITGRKQEASVTKDSDGDGIMDFDEINRFCSVSNDMDSDDDQVNDKNEIRSYTFHDSHHAGHENNALLFPDVDGDNLRAECDCDTDNDKDFDGGEDINGNGNSPQNGETCVYNPASFKISIQIDKPKYQPWENVMLSGGTFHANSTYGIDIIEDCIPLADSSALAHDDRVVTDANGNIILKNLGAFPPGDYKVVVDVLNDNIFRTGACHDPEVCFAVCEAPIIAWAPDTIRYPLAKTTTFNSLLLNVENAAQAVSQYYNAPQDITIHGVEFYAWSLLPDATEINVEIFIAGNDSIPMGPAIASTIVLVDSTFGSGNLEDLFKFALFPAPVTVNQPYVVVISNLSPIDVGIVTNGYQNGDGQNEWLASVNIFGNWFRGYDVDLSGSIMNADILSHPLVSYDFYSGFQPTNFCLSEPDFIGFIADVSPVIFDPMYNQAAFQNNLQNSFIWNFGDGSPPVQDIEPFHSYDGLGPYTVNLSNTIFGWTNECNEESNAIINPELMAEFTTTVANNNITLTNASSGIPDSYLWTFGDGSGSAVVQSPAHTYLNDGEYEICLSLNFGCGFDQSCQIIQTCAAMTAALSSSIDRKVVHFQDTTSGAPLSWLWDFGDGNASTEQHPSYEYDMNGTYTASLTTTNFCGNTDTTIKTINICAKPLACFNDSIAGLTAMFTDLSSESPDTWLWDFGDGNTSAMMAPSHTYNSSGVYIVCLEVSNTCGTDTYCNSVNINCTLPAVDFNFTINGLTLDFVDASSGNPSSWFWDFGDGNTDTVQNPTHTYAAPGDYTVSLISFNECGSDTLSQSILLTSVEELNPLVSIQVYPNPSLGHLFVKYYLERPAPVSIEIINLLGQSVYDVRIDQTSISQQMELDLSSVSKGVHLIVLHVEGSKVTRRILIL